MITEHESREEVERAVIGCIMLDAHKTMPHAVNEAVEDGWFINATLRKVYGICMANFATGKPIDTLTIGNALQGTERELVLDCLSEQITASYAPHYIEMLRSYNRYQQAATIAQSATRQLERVHPVESQPVIESIQTQMQSLGAEIVTTRPLGELARETVLEWQQPQTNRKTRVVWPLSVLNEIIGGLTDELVYICAGESVGKTAFSLQLLVENDNIRMYGAMASLESTVKRLIPRLISQIAQVNTLDVDRGHHTPEIMQRVEDAATRIAQLGFVATDRPMTLEQLHAWARLSVQRGAAFIVVDNTRHIKVTGNFGNDPVKTMSHVSIRLKQIRDDIGVPVFALHHTNKDGDVSWSRDLRKDVDVLIFLTHNEQMSVKPDAANKWRGKWFVDFTIDKNRDGRKGMTVAREFDKETQTFL
jgi:replicative DNA helicase